MPKSWLFVRRDESVYIARNDQYALLVCGPGTNREQVRFDNEFDVQRYQAQIAEQMAEGGWILYGVDRERRERARPAAAFNGPDRRQRA